MTKQRCFKSCLHLKLGHYTIKIFTEGESFFNKPIVIEGSADNLSCGDNLDKCLFVNKIFHRCRFLKFWALSNEKALVVGTYSEHCKTTCP